MRLGGDSVRGGSTGGEGQFALHALRDYTMLADGERGAILGPRGEIVWLCVPRWDSDAVFATLIGGEGVFAVTPAVPFVWGGYYEPGSLIWRSRWITRDSEISCREALAYPADPHRAVLLRRITAGVRPAPVRLRLDPRAEFGRRGLRAPRRGRDGAWSGRLGDLYLRLSGEVGDVAVRRAGRGWQLIADLIVPAGASRDLVLELSDRRLAAAPPEPADAWDGTEAAWAQRVPRLAGVTAGRDARHAYAVLSGMTSQHGGMVAAATTSLPERAQEGRNYDYRYAWIRDQCYAGQAVAAAGPFQLLDAAVSFVSERLHADGPALSPAYTVAGGRVPDQRQLNLPGYPGGFDLVGNWVNRQFQLDAFGEALLLLAAAGRRDRLGSAARQAAEIAADAVAARWQEPDAGIWELDNQAWTHSRLACVAGLRAAARWCASPALAVRWSGLADAITAEVSAHCVHPSGRWQRSATDSGLDAALLLPAVRGAVPADDPRTVETLRAYQAELTRDGHAYRFRHDDRPLEQAEGAFLLSGFVLALALHQQGREVDAARWFERTRAACGTAGLYCEEYDVAERQLRGNLPQAFVHALMLECAARLSVPWGERDQAASRAGHDPGGTLSQPDEAVLR
ncbi:MAG TPA: glycoside hydrolase family 15 protein [Streptosporangiaceae bacterium]